MYRNLLTRFALLAATALVLGACSEDATAPTASRQPQQGGGTHQAAPGQHAPKLPPKRRTVSATAEELQASSRLNLSRAAGTVAGSAATGRRVQSWTYRWCVPTRRCWPFWM